jgi:hypothetical protein
MKYVNGDFESNIVKFFDKKELEDIKNKLNLEKW